MPHLKDVPSASAYGVGKISFTTTPRLHSERLQYASLLTHLIYHHDEG